MTDLKDDCRSQPYGHPSKTGNVLPNPALTTLVNITDT